MRLTKLSLTNFKSFKDTQTIEFAPVTLLFGPNSVGKSTVLMALFYVQQILSKGQCNPQYIEALGNKFVGGFKNLVNGKDLSKTIAIKIEYTKADAIGSEYTAIRDFMNEDEELAYKLESLGLNLHSATENSEIVAIELQISWSETNNDAYVSGYSIWLDDQKVMTANSDSGMKQPQISYINYLHHAFLSYHGNKFLGSDGKPKMPAKGTPELEEFSKSYMELKESFSDTSFITSELKYLDAFVNNLSPIRNLIVFHELENFNFDEINDIDQSINRISFKGKSGALPLLNKPLRSTFSHEDNNITELVTELLSNAFVSPLDNLLKLLNDSLCIGPLRHIPDSNYQVNPYPEQADWYNGEACWDDLAKHELLRDCKINSWMNDIDKLNIGYKLVYKINDCEYRYVQPSNNINEVEDALPLKDALGDSLSISISKEDININPDSPQSFFSNSDISEFVTKCKHDYNYIDIVSDKNTSIALWDTHNNIEVSASDIGVGVSQILPLVVAAITSKGGLIACEQPELHVHPRVQVAIGDLITQANDKAQFLIETHSEHLILRILRRIRETSSNKLPEGLSPITPSDVSITYLEPSTEGVISRRYEIMDDGDFTEEWPSGFFDERDEELF